MNTDQMKFTEKKASHDDIFTHLMACNENFKPHLCKRVDIRDYAKKISSGAVTFEAWSNGKLVGLVAAYLNDMQGRHGYITNVSVMKEFMGKGIAAQLISMCLDRSKHDNFIDIMLEVYRENGYAIQLYQRFGFAPYRITNEQMFMKRSFEGENKERRGTATCSIPSKEYS